MTAPLHRLARRLANVPKGNPRFVRGKATKAVHRSAGTLSGEFEIDGNNDTTTASLPFYASWIGSVLSSSLSEGQLEAFKGLYLNDAHATNATTTVSESITAAFAEAQRERDAAVSRVNAIDAESLTLRLKLAAVDETAVERVRSELRATQLEAAEIRIALQALKFARQETKTVVMNKDEATNTSSSEILEISQRENELKLAVVSLERELENAHQRVTQAEQASANFAASVVIDMKAKSNNSRNTRNAANASALFTQTEHHPIFGDLLKDFGFKKVYAMPASVLSDKKVVKVYEQQRAFRKDRAEKIASMKSHDRFAVPGVISLAEGTANVKVDSSNGKNKKSALSEFFSGPDRSVSILDGQHRVGALEIFLKQGVINPTDEVLVEVFPEVCDQKASELFTEINQAQPIRFIDMPGVMDPGMKWALEGAAQHFASKYPAMFSNSVRCKLPNLNLDLFRETLHEAEVGSRFNLANEADFITWMSAENEKLSNRSEKEWIKRRPKRGKGSTGSKLQYVKALQKAKEHGFFLGMTDVWLDVKESEK